MGIGVAAVWLVVLVSAVPAMGARPPNVIVILADDAGPGDFSFTGNTNLATPVIDGLARDGARLERFF
ncbi:MAG: hypothetical protein ACKO9B_04840, partial [Planctomycetota bacterium]